ncbi:hypothetical protein HYALB_00004542 [Hymenoscyphus albidus]|uniref:Uncharacterized protein n=1 Tax=Hymenoscyphus albidus TaxID=595503 RepID=A0A9N9Q7S2_9HELO|nr:hypothetical protein HYALB_00004542 [Hymenoscyphus albidus]
MDSLILLLVQTGNPCEILPDAMYVLFSLSLIVVMLSLMYGHHTFFFGQVTLKGLVNLSIDRQNTSIDIPDKVFPIPHEFVDNMPPVRNHRLSAIYHSECARLPKVAFPFVLQHLILSTTQKLLEEVIFFFVKAWYPTLLEDNGWDTPEACELSLWWHNLKVPYLRQIPPCATLFNGGLVIETTLLRLAHLRHASVHRHVCSIAIIEAMMKDAVVLANGLNDFTRRNKLRCIELAVHTRDHGSIRGIIHLSLDSFKNFEYPGRVPGATFGSPRKELPLDPAAPLAPALLADKYRGRKYGFLPLGDENGQYRRSPSPPVFRPSVYPSGNTRSQARLRDRDRNEPYPTGGRRRGLVERAAKRFKSVSSLRTEMHGDMGKSDHSPFEITADSDEGLAKAHAKSLKVAADVGKSKETPFNLTVDSDDELNKAQSRNHKVGGDNSSHGSRPLQFLGNVFVDVPGDASGSRDNPFDLTADMDEQLERPHSKSFEVAGNSVSTGQRGKLCLTTFEDFKKSVFLPSENPQSRQTSFTISSISSSKQGVFLQDEVQPTRYMHPTSFEAPRQDAPSNFMAPQNGNLLLAHSTSSATELPPNSSHPPTPIETREALITPRLTQEQTAYQRALCIAPSTSIPNVGDHRHPTPTPSPVLQPQASTSLPQTAPINHQPISFPFPSQKPALVANTVWSTYREQESSPDGMDD